MIGLRGNKKVAAFLKKSGAKNFCSLEPVALKWHGPRVKSFFASFCSQKEAFLFA
jgi:hypothetical protein